MWGLQASHVQATASQRFFLEHHKHSKRPLSKRWQAWQNLLKQQQQRHTHQSYVLSPWYSWSNFHCCSQIKHITQLVWDEIQPAPRQPALNNIVWHLKPQHVRLTSLLQASASEPQTLQVTLVQEVTSLTNFETATETHPPIICVEPLILLNQPPKLDESEPAPRQHALNSILWHLKPQHVRLTGLLQASASERVFLGEPQTLQVTLVQEMPKLDKSFWNSSRDTSTNHMCWCPWYCWSNLHCCSQTKHSTQLIQDEIEPAPRQHALNSILWHLKPHMWGFQAFSRPLLDNGLSWTTTNTPSDPCPRDAKA